MDKNRKGGYVRGRSQHRYPLHQGRGRDSRQSTGKAAHPHAGRPDLLLSPPLGGSHEAVPHPRPAGGGIRLLPRYAGAGTHRPPHLRRSDGGEGARRGRGRRAGHHVFPSGIPQKRPPPGRDVYLLRQSRGRRYPPPDGQPPAGKGGRSAADGTHHARLPPDGGHHPDHDGQGRAAGAGRVPRPAGGRAARRDTAGAPPVLRGLRAGEHPLSHLTGGAEHRPAAAGVRGAVPPELRPVAAAPAA